MTLTRLSWLDSLLDAGNANITCSLFVDGDIYVRGSVLKLGPGPAPTPNPTLSPTHVPTPSPTRDPRSCKEVLDGTPTAISGYFTLTDGAVTFETYCDFPGGAAKFGAWTLSYSRSNAYWTPDHMRNLPQGAKLSPGDNEHSTSWYIPDDSTKWKWEVSVDSGSTWKQVTTSIPALARASTVATGTESLTVYDSTLATNTGTGTLQYRSYMFPGSYTFGNWFGIVTSAAADSQANVGIGAMSDGA
jgi:hypothetical protein